MKPTKMAINLVCLIGLTATSIAIAQPSPPRDRALSGIEKILSVYDQNLMYMVADININSGQDASLACAEVIFLDWHSLYSTALLSLSKADREGQEFIKFDKAAGKLNGDLSEVFEAGRPGISAAIRSALNEFRHTTDAKSPKAPEAPASLTVEDPKEALFSQTLRFCDNQDFLAEVNSHVQLADNSQDIARVVKSQVVDRRYSNRNALYTPMVTVQDNVTKTYGQWLRAIAERYVTY